MTDRHAELLEAALVAADLFAQTVEVNPLVLGDDDLRNRAQAVSAGLYEFYQKIGAAEFA